MLQVEDPDFVVHLVRGLVGSVLVDWITEFFGKDVWVYFVGRCTIRYARYGGLHEFIAAVVPMV